MKLLWGYYIDKLHDEPQEEDGDKLIILSSERDILYAA
jgi:hypothetical protein